jgi:hypothetical protein
MTASRSKVLWLRIVGRIAYYEMISKVFAYHIQIEHHGTNIRVPRNNFGTEYDDVEIISTHGVAWLMLP